MNDLSGLSWDAAPLNTNGANRTGTQSLFLSNNRSLPPAPRQATPLSAQTSGRVTPVNSSNLITKPAGLDSFANLIGNTSKKTNQLSLQERQKQLFDEKARQVATQQTPDDSHFWDSLGNGAKAISTGSLGSTKPSSNTTEDDDVLAAFNSPAPVDRASHFPPPRTGSAGISRTGSRNSSLPPQAIYEAPQTRRTPHAVLDDNDDDLFGLGQMPQKSKLSRAQLVQEPEQDDNEDLLGVLGQPVAQTRVAPPRKQELPPMRYAEDEDSSGEDAVDDAALAQVLDLGFSVEKSREALEHTANGSDVQAAVGWLLNKAHDESKSRAHTPASFEHDKEQRGRPSKTSRPEDEERHSTSTPAWMRNGQERQGRHSPAIVEGEITQYAAQMGSSIYKSANILWKTGQKKVQKAAAEYREGERDTSQPKWMRSTREDESRATDHEGTSRPQAQIRSQQSSFTNEALLLDSRDKSDPRHNNRRGTGERKAEPEARQHPQPHRTPHTDKEFLGRSQAASERYTSPAQQQPQNRPQVVAPSRPAERLRKQIIEEETAQAYISPSRRRKAQPTEALPPPTETTQPQEQKAAGPELDIFSSDFATAPPRPQTTANVPSSLPPSRASTPMSIRPKATTRTFPAVSAGALSISTTHRLAGTEAFKRGDYGTAQISYTAAMAALPPAHPVNIILYTNRALTLIKTGDAKAAINDADAALTAIGSSRGEGEAIALDDGTEKPMKEYYGKALMRKAEALEHLEKWSNAAGVWREAISVGVGGAVSIQGRNRCEKAAGESPSAASRVTAPISRPASAPAVVRKPPPARNIPSSSKLSNVISNGTSGSSEAAERLRAANAAAVAASDEAFALNDSVDGKLTAWKAGKEGNLRALLASLDTVLWSDAGWNKVGMGDLVLPNRVKIIYMKAIAKVHPDKLSQSATTEQKMVSAAVFAILNQAWDKFKQDNGM